RTMPKCFSVSRLWNTINWKCNNTCDRFLSIDDDVYHIGASIKDLGKKWFGFSKMEILTPYELVERINRE
ncbi:MAG: hypothetical protein SPE27_05875, partial [Prevotella sp.]|nr:hypothetical protein [Prevotella sp.]